MSTRKPPPRPQHAPAISTTTMTPTRYQPSTPHAIRALQQRSGLANRTRSLRTQRVTDKITSLDSARGILRQLAKITAPKTKKHVVTPTVGPGKENEYPNSNGKRGAEVSGAEADGEEEDDSMIVKKPKLSLDVEEEDGDDSGLPIPPTPSILLDDDEEDENEATLTFRAVDFARATQPASERIDRRKSLLSMRGELENDNDQDDVDEDDRNNDSTIMTERGRRAISEEPTRVSRYSFGSIRMSGFGSELEIPRDSIDKDARPTLSQDEGYGGFDLDDQPLFLPEETIDLGQNQTPDSPQSSDAETTVHIHGADETFQLEGPNTTQDVVTANDLRALDAPARVENVGQDDQPAIHDDEDDSSTRQQTVLELAASRSQSSRRKRLKLTRHGTLVPALPSSLLRHIVNENQTKHGKRKLKLGKDHMKALEQAAEWFFEQVGEDLAAYSDHAGHKKRVESEDVLLLMRRQKVLREPGQLLDAAETWLPKKVLDELDVPEEL